MKQKLSSQWSVWCFIFTFFSISFKSSNSQTTQTTATETLQKINNLIQSNYGSLSTEYYGTLSDTLRRFEIAEQLITGQLGTLANYDSLANDEDFLLGYA